MSTTLTKNQSANVFQLKGSLFTLTVLQLIDTDEMLLDRQLASTISKTPKFFQNAPMVIDLSLLPLDEDINLAGINKLLRQHGVVPVGVRGATESQQEKARLAGLAVLATTVPETKPAKSAPQRDVKEKTNKPANYQPTKLITQPVRSGQQIYAKNSDLIVFASVSAGAEILADGNIHVYGPLRGRALAGIMGDTNAQIFCQSLEAELVSIAGRYLVNENLSFPSAKGYINIHLNGEQLEIKTI